MMTTTKRITIGEFGKVAAAFREGWQKQFDNRTRTENPKGKVGKLEYLRWWDRDFAKGNVKWIFRKFEKKTFDNAEGFIKALERRGFKRLGSGAFSTVMAKDGQKRVIKVIRRPDGWINYVVWAAKIGEAGRFAPQVFSYKKIKGNVKDFAVAIVERLEYTLEDTPEDHALKILPEMLWRAEKNPMAQKFTELLAPGLVDYLKKMGEQWKITYDNFDLHAGNLMVRANGTFVVVDPVSRGEEGYIRLRAGDLTPAVALKLLALIGFNRLCQH